jgi:hypothetical protein
MTIDEIDRDLEFLARQAAAPGNKETGRPDPAVVEHLMSTRLCVGPCDHQHSSGAPKNAAGV